MNVSATPIPVARANSRSAAAAPRARDAVAGQHDRVARVADQVGRAQQLAARPAPGAAGRAPGAAARRRAARAMTSSGSSMWVGPGFGSCATLNALRTTSGIDRRGVQPRVPLRDRLEHRARCRCTGGTPCACAPGRAWPVRATSGERSRKASATAGDEVRRARAERAEAHAGAPGQPAVHVRHVGAALLVAHRDERDRRAPPATR